jgi:hypothetical protein
MNRSGIDIAAGQGARAEVEMGVIERVLRRVAGVSCELVLFMLTVSPSCEGDHA